jgi:hypothetical protein
MPMHAPQPDEQPIHESIIRRLGQALRAIIDRKDAEILILEREVELMRQRILALEERLEQETGFVVRDVP